MKTYLLDNSNDITITKSQATLSVPRKSRIPNTSPYTSKLQISIQRFIRFSEKYPFLLTLFKLLLGIVSINIPLYIMIFFVETTYGIPARYLLLPYFIITLSLLGSILIIVCVIRICNECLLRGIAITTWTRKNICKIFNALIYVC